MLDAGYLMLVVDPVFFSGDKSKKPLLDPVSRDQYPVSVRIRHHNI